MAENIYVNTFPDGCRVEWGAADTETITYIDGVAVTTDQLREMGRTRPVKWFRQHTTVKAYAWIFSDGDHLAILPDFETFAAFLSAHYVRVVWWYNCKFDFANIDYETLKSGWTRQDKGRLKHRCFNSLHSAFGARYSMSFGYEHKGKNGKTAVHATKHVDFCNIFGGGLAKVLESFNVTGFDGVPIRKLSADYQAGASIEYMEHDAKGLFHAVRIASDFLFINFGMRLTGTKPDAITAGGLAKKILLRYLYPDAYDDRTRSNMYRDRHGIFVDNDRWYRKRGLYRGAITYLNPRYATKPQHGNLYRYDVNSMYPSIMAEMPDITGAPRRITLDEYQSRKGTPDVVHVLEFTEIRGEMRRDMLPIWYDTNAKKYTPHAQFSAAENAGIPLLMYAKEWEEVSSYWYDMLVNVSWVYEFRTKQNDGYARFVNSAYQMKADGKREHNAVKTAFAKLLLNSSYGKLAENPARLETWRVLDADTDTVRMVTGKTEIDENSLLSVVQGAYVTMGARVKLLHYIREICPIPARDFLYCDTDSVHAFKNYDKCDAYALGAMKNETGDKPFNFFIYLAPKTYFDAHVDGEAVTDIEIHSKGISTKDVASALDGMTVSEIQNRFCVGAKFQPLSAMNVPGGKALIPIEKYLCREDNSIVYVDENNDPLIFESEE